MTDAHPPEPLNKVRYFGIGAAALALWWALYSLIVPLAQWLTYDLFALGKGSPRGAAVEFFFYDTAKIMLLLILMVYVIAWLRAAMQVERVRDYLAGKGAASAIFLVPASVPSRRFAPAPAFRCFSASPWRGFRWALPWPS